MTAVLLTTVVRLTVVAMRPTAVARLTVVATADDGGDATTAVAMRTTGGTADNGGTVGRRGYRRWRAAPAMSPAATAVTPTPAPSTSTASTCADNTDTDSVGNQPVEQGKGKDELAETGAAETTFLLVGAATMIAGGIGFRILPRLVNGRTVA